MPTKLSSAQALALGLRTKRKATKRHQALGLPRCEPRGLEDKQGVTLYVPLIPRSGNTFIRIHGIKRWREQRDLGWFFKAAEADIQHRKKKSRARILITVASTRKHKDFDNFITGLKPFVDWLKKLGWIVDDNETWLDYLKPAQVRTTAELKAGTHIRIEYEETT